MKILYINEVIRYILNWNFLIEDPVQNYLFFYFIFLLFLYFLIYILFICISFLPLVTPHYKTSAVDDHDVLRPEIPNETKLITESLKTIK